MPYAFRTLSSRRALHPLDSIPAKALRCMGECSITASPEKVSGAHPGKARNSNFVGVVVVFIVVWGVRSCICVLSTSCTIGYITVFNNLLDGTSIISFKQHSFIPAIS